MRIHVWLTRVSPNICNEAELSCIFIIFSCRSIRSSILLFSLTLVCLYQYIIVYALSFFNWLMEFGNLVFPNWEWGGSNKSNESMKTLWITTICIGIPNLVIPYIAILCKKMFVLIEFSRLTFLNYTNETRNCTLWNN